MEAVQRSAEQSRAEQSRAEQSRAEQSRAEQRKAMASPRKKSDAVKSSGPLAKFINKKQTPVHHHCLSHGQQCVVKANVSVYGAEASACGIGTDRCVACLSMNDIWEASLVNVLNVDVTEL
jgi:hypothetical protein